MSRIAWRISIPSSAQIAEVLATSMQTGQDSGVLHALAARWRERPELNLKTFDHCSALIKLMQTSRFRAISSLGNAFAG